jgi:cytosine/adenosine deaminase-related metal-dependent hydrolase
MKAHVALLVLLITLAGPARAGVTVVKGGMLITERVRGEEPFLGYFAYGDDGRIITVGAGDPPASLIADHVIDATGKMVAPGFISAHSHLYSGPLRGLGVTETLYGWGRAWGIYNQLASADDIYWFTLNGSVDFLRNGITTAFDFTYSPVLGGQAVGAGEQVPPPKLKVGPFDEKQLQAKIDAGLRFVNGVGIPRVGTHDQMIARFGRIYQYSIDHYGKNPLFLKTALSGGLQRAPTKDTAYLEVEVMKKFKVLNHSHFLESPDRVPEQQAKFYWYQEAGALGPDFIFAHFIQTNDEIVRIAGAAGCKMSWQPTSNSRLASGVADIVQYQKAGVGVSVGLDNQSCTDLCDPFQNLRIGLALIRTKYKDAKALSVEEMLYLHTLGSARVLGIDRQVGSLEPGKFADFLIVDPRDPETGPILNPVAHYVYACGLRNLQKVYVGGKLVVDGTRVLTFDESVIRKEIDQRVARLHAQVMALPKAAADAMPIDLNALQVDSDMVAAIP